MNPLTGSDKNWQSRLFHEIQGRRDQDCAVYRRLLCTLRDLQGGCAALPRDWVLCTRIDLHLLSSIEWLRARSGGGFRGEAFGF